jgi:hypothetical protein
MAVTIDPRPTYFGDRMIVTGSYTGGAATEAIALGSLLASVDAFIVNPSQTTPQAVDPADGAGDTEVAIELLDVATLSGTTITVTQATDQANVVAGTFLAIGRRS